VGDKISKQMRSSGQGAQSRKKLGGTGGRVRRSRVALAGKILRHAEARKKNTWVGWRQGVSGAGERANKIPHIATLYGVAIEH